MKIRNPDLNDQSINPEHQALGIPPIEYEVTHASEHPLLRLACYLVITLLLGLIIYFGYRLFGGHGLAGGMDIIEATLHDPMFWTALAVGLLAQIIDGALGMAYGLTATSFLLAFGASPAMASGATHLAEVFTTGVSGVSHLKLGNVHKRLFFSLLLPGIVGALIGTYILSNVDGALLKPFIAAYLIIMGLYVFSKAFRKIHPSNKEISHRKVAPLALLGGFMDTTGGGGWGPIVTTTLVSTGHDPRTTIGSVNLAEFFLTITTAAAFFAILDHTVWVLVAGLTIGGLFAAPFAALITRKLNTRVLLMLVGTLITAISVFNLYKALN